MYYTIDIMKKWLVAHRGAPNEAKENTLSAFAEAKKYPIGYIEFDVHVTKDDVAIIHHDPEIKGRSIAKSTYAELLVTDPELAHFEDVVLTNNGQPLIVELKSSGAAPHVALYLSTHPKSLATSFMDTELISLSHLDIAKSRMLLAQHKHPIGLIKKAKRHNFGGVTVNKWYLTPSFYFRARRNHLAVFVYTVNSPHWARFMRIMFPNALICTDRPDILSRLN